MVKIDNLSGTSSLFIVVLSSDACFCQVPFWKILPKKVFWMQRQLYEAFLKSDWVHSSMDGGSPLAALTVNVFLCSSFLFVSINWPYPQVIIYKYIFMYVLATFVHEISKLLWFLVFSTHSNIYKLENCLHLHIMNI